MSDGPIRGIWFFCGSMLIVAALKLTLEREFVVAATVALLGIGFWILALKPRTEMPRECPCGSHWEGKDSVCCGPLANCEMSHTIRRRGEDLR